MKQKRGRPSKKLDYSDEIEIEINKDDYNNYISLDQDCVKLLKLFATQGTYQIQILTNNKKLKIYDKQQVETIQQTCNQYNNNCPELFFLSSRKKNYSFENQKLVDKTKYMRINSSQFDPKFQILITKLNKVFKELDEQFIFLLYDILIQYTNLFDNNLEQNSVVQYIIYQIQDPNNFDQFQYLLNWQTLKNITKEVRMNMAFEQVQNFQTQINKRNSKKVIKKHQEFIDKQTRHLNQETMMEPIEYLITKLIGIFNKIMANH